MDSNGFETSLSLDQRSYLRNLRRSLLRSLLCGPAPQRLLGNPYVQAVKGERTRSRMEAPLLVSKELANHCVKKLLPHAWADPDIHF